jgi:hypothetical protein
MEYLQKVIIFLRALKLKINDDQVELHQKVRSLVILELQVKKQIARIEGIRGQNSQTFGQIYKFLVKFEEQCRVLNQTQNITSDQIMAYDKSIDEFIRDIQIEIEQLPRSFDPKKRENQLQQLKEWGFPVDLYSEETQFAIEHFTDCEIMAKAVGEKTVTFYKMSLPKIIQAGLFNSLYWQGLVELTQKNERKTPALFMEGLPALVKAGLVTEQYWPILVKTLPQIGQAAGKNAEYLFQISLPSLVKAGLVNEQNWPNLVDMAKASGEKSHYLFEYGLPTVAKAGLVNEQNWPKLLEMVQASGKNSWILFQHGLPELVKAGLLTEQSWPYVLRLITKHIKESEEKITKLRKISYLPTEHKGIASYLLVYRPEQFLEVSDLLDVINVASLELDSTNKLLALFGRPVVFESNNPDYLVKLLSPIGESPIEKYYLYLCKVLGKKANMVKVQDYQKKVLNHITISNDFQNQRYITTLKKISEIFANLLF